MSTCTHICECEQKAFELDREDLPNQVVTNMLAGGAGAIWIVRNAESVREPNAFIYHLLILSATEAMLSQSMRSVFKSSAAIFGPITSVAIVSGLTYGLGFDIFKVELSKDARLQLLASVASYALFKGAIRQATMVNFSLPIGQAIKGTGSCLYSLFKNTVSRPLTMLANSLHSLWLRNSVPDDKKMQ